MSGRRPSLEELSAYLDGELDETRRAAVEAHLRDCPEDAARIADYRHHDMLLRAAFHELAPARLPESLDHALRARRRVRLRAALAAAAVLVVAVLSGAWWLSRGEHLDPALATLARNATTAYQLYTLPSSSSSSPPPGQPAADLGQWLSIRVGRHVWVPDLSRFGYHLVAARLLPGSPHPAAQLIFADTAGHRISCYFAAHDGAGETALHYREVHGVRTFFKFDDGLGYAVSGEIDRSALHTLAQTAYQAGEQESSE